MRAAPRSWCRRGDSNSHGLRHCPLKTACLPISPRRRSTAFDQRLRQQRAAPHRLFRHFARLRSRRLAGAAPIARARRAGGVARRLPALRRPWPRAFRRYPAASGSMPVPCDVANHVSPRLDAKNSAARTAVVRDRKLADPAAPNRLPDEPLPNAAPMSAPLPCWSSTSPQIAGGHDQVDHQQQRFQHVHSLLPLPLSRAWRLSIFRHAQSPEIPSP